MSEDNTPQNTPTPRKPDQARPDQTQPEKPRRRKKAPPIDFNAMDERDQKLLQNIAATGARVAGRQKKLREGQLNAMKATLADIFAAPDEADPQFVELFFEVMLDYATSANAKKIAGHPLCPADMADA